MDHAKQLEKLIEEQAKLLATIHTLEELLALRSQEFSPTGCIAFFKLMHTIPLHKAGNGWTNILWESHAKSKGYLNKVHREGAKTTWTKFFLAFFIGHHPELSNMMVRINDNKANETSQAIADIIEYNPLWKLVFPHVVPDKQKGWGASGYEVMRDDMPYSEWSELKTKLLPDPSFVGYGYKSGSIIGSRINGVFVGDDVHDEINTSSDRQLRAVIKWYTDTMSPCLMEGCWEIWDYTPWLDTDLYAYLEATSAYTLSTTPLLVAVDKEDPRAELWPEDPRIPLSGQYYYRYWPEAWSWDRITDKFLKSGTIGFARMFMLDLEQMKGIKLRWEWIHKYPASDIDPSWPVYMGIDYASTWDKLKHKDRDYFALAIARAIPGGGIVIVDGVRQHVSKGEAMQIVQSYANMHPNYQLIGVESIGSGKEFYNDLLLSKDLTGKILKLFEIPYHGKSKGKRFEDWLAPRCQAARIWFSNVENEFLRAFYDEWLTYDHGQFDDCIDAVYMCTLAAEGFLPSKAVRTGTKRKQINPYDSLVKM